MPAVTLDLWHTLIYLPPEDEEAYMAHQIALGTEVLHRSARVPGSPARTDDELRQAFERAYAEAVEASARGVSVTPAEQLVRAARATGRAANPDDYLNLLKEEVARTPFRTAPGAVELLRDLRARGLRVGVISNTVGEPGEYLRPTLSRIGFDRFVESYVFSDQQPWTKPSPEIFRYALSTLHETPENAVHVGDGWADLEGARRAGYRGAVLFTGLHEYGEKYLRLFLSGSPPASAETLRTDRLERVLPLVEDLLAPRKG